MKNIFTILILFICANNFGQDTKKVYKTFNSEQFEFNDRIVTPNIVFSMGGHIHVLQDCFDSVKVIADFLIANPKIEIEIGVHTDYRGGEASNLKISEFRAKAVKTVLENKFNIQPERLKTKGYGESEPLIPAEQILAATEVEKENLHAINRRTEIIILKM